MDYQKILKGIHQEIEPYATIGKQADYIPALAKINPDQFGMCIPTIQGETFMHGEATTGFSIQSISKVFSLAMCLSLEGDNLRTLGHCFQLASATRGRKRYSPKSIYQCRRHCDDRHSIEPFKASKRGIYPFCPFTQQKQPD